jgi:monoterpene epsilon-lactone hydrolase
MGVADRAAVLAMLREHAAPDFTLAGQRARMDAVSDVFHPPEGAEVQTAEVGGVAGEWVRARRTLADAALLYLHGGGYVNGSPTSHRHLAAAIGEASGLPVFVAEYRRAPEHPFPAALEDAVAAYKGLLASGLSPARLAIGGDSSGGGLAIATLVSLREQNVPLPACVACISPWADLTQSGETFRTHAALDPTISKARLDAMAAQYLAGRDPTTPLASPLYADLSGLPPLLLQVGGREVLFDDTMRLRARAEEARVEVSVESWGGLWHVWPFYYPMLSEGRDAIARIGAYLKARIA